MEQSEINKKLYEAIEVNASIYLSDESKSYAATACEIICLQEKKDLMQDIANKFDAYSYIGLKLRIKGELNKYTEQLNDLKNK